MRWIYAKRDSGDREPLGRISECGRFRIGEFHLGDKAIFGLYDGLSRVGFYGSMDDAKKMAQTLI